MSVKARAARLAGKTELSTDSQSMLRRGQLLASTGCLTRDSVVQALLQSIQAMALAAEWCHGGSQLFIMWGRGFDTCQSCDCVLLSLRLRVTSTVATNQRFQTSGGEQWSSLWR